MFENILTAAKFKTAHNLYRFPAQKPHTPAAKNTNWPPPH